MPGYLEFWYRTEVLALSSHDSSIEIYFECCIIYVILNCASNFHYVSYINLILERHICFDYSYTIWSFIEAAEEIFCGSLRYNEMNSAWGKPWNLRLRSWILIVYVFFQGIYIYGQQAGKYSPADMWWETSLPSSRTCFE